MSYKSFRSYLHTIAVIIGFVEKVIITLDDSLPQQLA